MSVHVTSWVLRNSEAHLGDRLVLLALADHAKDDGTYAWPSVETIAREAHLSSRQVRRCLRNLEESGSITQTGTSRAGTHIYTVNMTPGHIVRPRTNRAGDADDLSAEPSLEQPSEDLAAAPRARPRNELWDALETIFGPATTRSAQQVRGKVVAGLAVAGATPAEINRRARAWPQHFDGATMTDLAFEKHYDTLGRKPLRRR